VMFINMDSGCERHNFKLQYFHSILLWCDVIFLPVLYHLLFYCYFLTRLCQSQGHCLFLTIHCDVYACFCRLLFIKYASKFNLPCLFFYYMSWLQTGVRHSRSSRSFHIVSKSFNIFKLWGHNLQDTGRCLAAAQNTILLVWAAE